MTDAYELMKKTFGPPEELKMIFGLGEKQFKVYQEWRERHDKECPLTNGKDAAIGGRTTFSFSPTGLGDIVTVKCSCEIGDLLVDLTFSEDW